MDRPFGTYPAPLEDTEAALESMARGEYGSAKSADSPSMSAASGPFLRQCLFRLQECRESRQDDWVRPVEERVIP